MRKWLPLEIDKTVAKYLWAVFAVLLCGCAKTTIPPLTQMAIFPNQCFMKPADLPPGWSGYMSGALREIPADAIGGMSNYSFPVPGTGRGWNIRQQLTLYPNETRAKEAYADWYTAWFPVSDWQNPAEASFVPSDSGDQFYFACLDSAINGLAVKDCGYLQRHHHLISFITSQIDGKAITIGQFETALKSIDDRCQDIGTSLPGTATALP